MRRNSNGIGARVLVMAVALTLIIGGIIGGAVAWLTAKTEPVVNTFTVGDINITLTESTGTSYTFIPGKDISKDPKVTVAANSETCYLFIKVTKENWPSTSKISYTMAEGWNELTGNEGVFYREVASSTSEQAFHVITGDKIMVSSELTKAELNDFATPISFSVKAFAVQKDGIADANAAWDVIPTADKN